MALAVEPFPRQQGLRLVGAGGQQQLSLLLERQTTPGPGGSRLIEALPVLGAESVADVKMRLRRSKRWFAAGSTLVYGDRELLDSELLGSLSAAKEAEETSSSHWVHLYVRLRDVAALTASGVHKGTVDYDGSQATSRVLPRSALSASLADAASRRAALDAKLQTAAWPAISSPAAVEEQEDMVLHLVIRRDAKISWRHTGSDEVEILVACDATAAEAKRSIARHAGPAGDYDLAFRGQVLQSGLPLAHYGVGKQGATLDLVPHRPAFSLSPASPSNYPQLSSPEHGLHESWRKARAGLAAGRVPILAPSGTGGSYFLKDELGTTVAVFKPLDEEPMAPSNPRTLRLASSAPPALSAGPFTRSLKRGVLPGEGAVREVAAYVLDHGHFSGVPPTAMVSCQQDHLRSGASAKVGSLQGFVQSDGDCEERGSSTFPVHEVHKIAVLDLRLVNLDRNGGNILARNHARRGWQLTPIDHGFCLPDSWMDVSFEWLWWPQARRPFSAAARAYIASLDAEADLALLAANGLAIRPECRRIFQAACMVLQEGARRGLTAFQMGTILSRESLGKSKVEKLHKRAIQLACAAGGGSSGSTRPPALGLTGKHSNVTDACFLSHFRNVLIEFLEDITTDDLSELSIA